MIPYLLQHRAGNLLRRPSALDALAVLPVLLPAIAVRCPAILIPYEIFVLCPAPSSVRTCSCESLSRSRKNLKTGNGFVDGDRVCPGFADLSL